MTSFIYFTIFDLNDFTKYSKQISPVFIGEKIECWFILKFSVFAILSKLAFLDVSPGFLIS